MHNTELHLAALWTCECCGRDNVARIALTQDESDGKAYSGMTSWEVVACVHCGTAHQASMNPIFEQALKGPSALMFEADEEDDE